LIFNMIISLEEVDSTNNYAKLLLSKEEVKEGTLIRTRFQTTGRGQHQNRWESERDANLTFSLLLHPYVLPADEPFFLSQITALGVVDFLSSSYELENLSIKWPNDIYWKDKKIGGILIENLLSGQLIAHSILGVGVNINQTVFGGDVPNPVSVKQITGNDHDLETAYQKIRDCILARY